MNFNTLKTMPKEDAFIALVTALDETPEYDGVTQRRTLSLWRKLENHYGEEVMASDAWRWFDKKHGTDVAGALQRMADSVLPGGKHV